MIRKLIIASFLSSIIHSCSNQEVKTETETVAEANEAFTLTENFIYGLWSLDSGQQLINEGYFFQNNGVVDLVASEARGSWKLTGTDSIEIELPTYDYFPVRFSYHIDSISDGWMVLSDSSGKHVFRKVPFGLNTEGNLMSGFMGRFTRTFAQRSYTVNLPTAKRIGISVDSKDTSIVFSLWEKGRELTSVKVRSWEGILIRGGDYRIELEHSNPRNIPYEGADYNVKIMSY